MPSALITGGNRGLGLATAKQLADKGFRVMIGCRDAAAGEAAAQQLGANTSAVALDVTDPGSIRAAADEVERQYGELDVLVNNAGILPEATNAEPAEIVDASMFRQTFETNVLGAVNVLEVFLPLLRKSGSARIVNVSTTMGSLADQVDPDSPFYGMVVPAYQSSKAALNNVTIALTKQLTESTIKATSVCPGFVRTDLTPINKEQASLTPEQAAEPIVRAATLPEAEKSGQFIDATGNVDW